MPAPPVYRPSQGLQAARPGPPTHLVSREALKPPPVYRPDIPGPVQTRKQPLVGLKAPVPVSNALGIQNHTPPVPAGMTPYTSVAGAQPQVKGVQHVNGIARQTKTVPRSVQRTPQVLQRRVLTIGEVDTEVELSQEYLARSIAQFPQSGWSVVPAMGSFEAVPTLLDTELEILVGHGNPKKMGDMDRATLVNALASRMEKGKSYNFLFFACSVAQAPAENKSLAAEVAEDLRAKQFTVSVTAPEGLVFVIGENSYVQGNPFNRNEEKLVEPQRKQLYYRALTDTIDTLVEELGGDLSIRWPSFANSITTDIATLKGCGVKAAKLPIGKNESQKDFLKRVVTAIKTEDQQKTANAICTRLQQVMSLLSYKALVVGGLSFAELLRLLEARYFRNIYYPAIGSKLQTDAGGARLLRSLPGKGSEGWQTIEG
ncbi:MAG: hypothetical protein ACJ746_03590 [Bryobacteraceae bacterium]